MKSLLTHHAAGSNYSWWGRDTGPAKPRSGERCGGPMNHKEHHVVSAQRLWAALCRGPRKSDVAFLGVVRATAWHMKEAIKSPVLWVCGVVRGIYRVVHPDPDCYLLESGVFKSWGCRGARCGIEEASLVPQSMVCTSLRSWVQRCGTGGWCCLSRKSKKTCKLKKTFGRIHQKKTDSNQAGMTVPSQIHRAYAHWPVCFHLVKVFLVKEQHCKLPCECHLQ